MDRVNSNSEYKKEILQPMVVASLLLLMALIALTYVAEDLINLDNQKVALNKLQYHSLQLKNVIVDAETNQRGYLLTGNPSFLDSYQDTQQVITRLHQQIQMSIKASGLIPLSSTMRDIQQAADKKFLIIDKNIQIQLNGGAYASHLNVDKEIGADEMQYIRNQFKSIDGKINLERQTVEVQIKRRFKQVLFGAASLVGLITMVLVAAYRRTLSLFDGIMKAKEDLQLLKHLVGKDALTNILNRHGFELKAEQVFQNALSGRREFAIFYMDLDGFKHVNDAFGHDVGDEALTIVVQRFTRVLRESDILSRVGGDEFTLIVQRNLSLIALNNLASRLIESLDSHIDIDGKSMQLGVSIGIAIYPQHSNNLESLIAMADEAMYAAKKAGKNRVMIANSDGASA